MRVSLKMDARPKILSLWLIVSVCLLFNREESIAADCFPSPGTLSWWTADGDPEDRVGENPGELSSGVASLTAFRGLIYDAAADMAVDELRPDSGNGRIGNPSPGASIAVNTQSYLITAGGRGIGGNADQFHFNAQQKTGDFDMRVRVDSLDASDLWAQAGLMARETVEPGSRFVSVLATPSLGGVFLLTRATQAAPTQPAGNFPVNFLRASAPSVPSIHFPSSL